MRPIRLQAHWDCPRELIPNILFLIKRFRCARIRRGGRLHSSAVWSKKQIDNQRNLLPHDVRHWHGQHSVCFRCSYRRDHRQQSTWLRPLLRECWRKSFFFPLFPSLPFLSFSLSLFLPLLSNHVFWPQTTSTNRVSIDLKARRMSIKNQTNNRKDETEMTKAQIRSISESDYGLRFDLSTPNADQLQQHSTKLIEIINYR